MDGDGPTLYDGQFRINALFRYSKEMGSSRHTFKIQCMDLSSDNTISDRICRQKIPKK